MIPSATSRRATHSESWLSGAISEPLMNEFYALSLSPAFWKIRP